MQTSQQKVAYYRRAIPDSSVSNNLQQLLSFALQQLSKVKDRAETTDAAGSAFRVIGSSKTVEGMLCGTLISFERGAYQLVVEEDPNATTLTMGAIEPSSENGTQRHFAPGVLFFCVFENHVAVVHSQALKTSALEAHFAWLFRSATKLLSNTQGIVLSDEIQAATKDRIRKSHVKSLAIGRPFMQSAAGTPESGAITSLPQRSVAKLKPDPGFLGLLRSMIPIDRFAKLGLEEAVFDGELEVWIQLRYPKYSRSQPSDTVHLMDDLAIALRDQDEDSVALVLADNTKVSGSELKISTPISLKNDKGVPNETAFYEDLSKWLKSLLVNKMVSS